MPCKSLRAVPVRRSVKNSPSLKNSCGATACGPMATSPSQWVRLQNLALKLISKTNSFKRAAESEARKPRTLVRGYSFSDAVTAISPVTPSLGEYPLSRSERKPSGTMSRRLVNRLIESDDIWDDPKRVVALGLIIAFVGDKLSDMREAEALHRTGITVVGFMVPRLGNADHPLDTAFGKRRKATAARDEFKANAQNIFVR